VKQRWTFRSKSLFDKEKNLRGLKWEALDAYYEDKLSGVRFAERHKVMVAHLKMIVFRMGNDILEDNEYAHTAYRMVSAQWRSCIETQAKTPFQIPTQMGRSISGHDAQYLTRITKHCVRSKYRHTSWLHTHWRQCSWPD
jgi:hypothetical protein